MGCSNPHPHGRVWASNFTCRAGRTRIVLQKAYFAEQHVHMLVDYVQRELADGSRHRGRGKNRTLAGGGALLGGVAVRRYCYPNACPAHYRFKRRGGATLWHWR